MVSGNKEGTEQCLMRGEQYFHQVRGTNVEIRGHTEKGEKQAIPHARSSCHRPAGLVEGTKDNISSLKG